MIEFVNLDSFDFHIFFGCSQIEFVLLLVVLRMILHPFIVDQVMREFICKLPVYQSSQVWIL